MSKAADLFFSVGKNLYGHSDTMDLNLGNYKGEIINKENFSVQKYIVDHRLSKTRIYLMSKLKSNNQLVKEIANSTTIFINGDVDDDVEIPPPFLQSNSLSPDDSLNISDSSSQAISSVSSLNQISVAQYENSYIDPFPEPVSEGQRNLLPLSTLPLDNLRSPDLFNIVNSNRDYIRTADIDQ